MTIPLLDSIEDVFRGIKVGRQKVLHISNCAGPMLIIPLVFGHLRLVIAFRRPGDDPDGSVGERLSLNRPLFSGFFSRSGAISGIAA